MEWPETGTYRTCLDPALETLELMIDKVFPNLLSWSSRSDRIWATLQEFRFFKIFLWGLEHWQVSEEYDWYLRSVTNTMGHKLRRTVEEFQDHIKWSVVPKGEFTTWEQLLVDQLEERIEPFKRQVKEICILSLGGEIRCKPCQQDLELFLEYGRETASFIEFVLDNLQDLNSHYHLMAPAKQQIDEVLRKFTNPVSHSITRVKNLGELISQTRTWANHLSCLTCLYWIDGLDESLSSTVGTMLSDFMQKTMPITPGVVASYFEGALFPQILASYIDFLLEELVMPLMKDSIKTLGEGLIFLLSIMIHPPEEDSEEKDLILGQVYSIINELPSLIWSIHPNEMKDGISETKLSDFLQMIVRVEAEVKKRYAITPRSTQINSPRTNAVGFLDSLLQKLKKWLEGEVNLIASGNYGTQTVLEELASLRPFMQHLTEIQNEQEERKDLWTRIVNLVYYASYVSSFCAAKSFSMWYGITCLPCVIEEIKIIKNEVMEIKDPQMCKSKMLSVEMKSRITMLPRITTSKDEGAFISFKEDIRSIIDHLIGGRKDLTIISISGMPAQGKTTLAKRIYNDPEIQYHFHKTVWCYVSKERKIRDLLIHIVHDVSKSDEDISKLETQDVVERLRKCLKGRRYLVVMDDIWDDEVWCQVQSSFPDDKLGSRILFTSRNHKLKPQDERNFISYPLRSFSQEESWDLMKDKISHYSGLGPEFLEIGKRIAKSCEGLPLAVALVGSLLGKTEQKLELWKQIAENLKSHLASEEGCMHIIELSYEYLPEHLKSCFLYFGAFPRGKNIRAKRLMLLWIAEGFMKENEMRCLKDLAKECLDYLVSHSLVVVAERSSMGGIKKCNIHDLLYDLCLKKIAEDNFLHLIDGKTVRDECHSSPQKYGHHRLCIDESDPLMESTPTCRRKELPASLVQSIMWLERFSGNDFDRVILISFLKSFKVLTVLNLERVNLGGDVFPEVILCNIHLKYLALCEHIKYIPPSIADLWNLETLIFSRAGPYGDTIKQKIPDSMWRMKSLRHVSIFRCCLSLEDLEGNECCMAARHNMETLCGLFLGDDYRRTVEFLGRMKRLRKLKCRVEGDALFSIFRSLENLEELHIGGIRFDSETCNSFPQNKNLRKLSLVGSKVASWSAMSTIGKQFPNLEVLKLSCNDCVASRWDLEDGEFSKVKYLKLEQLYVTAYHIL